MKKVLIVGIFIFMTKWNFMLSWVEHEKKVLIVGIFIFITKWNFMLSRVEHDKKFYNSGPDLFWSHILKSKPPWPTNIKTIKLYLNIDGSFTVADPNLCSSLEILPIGQENKYSGKFSLFIIKICILCVLINMLAQIRCRSFSVDGS